MNKADLIGILPEIILCIFAMVILLVDVFTQDKEDKITPLILAIIGLALSSVASFSLLNSNYTVFNNMIIVDPFSNIFKIIFYVSTLMSILISQKNLMIEKVNQGEFYVIVLFATVGMMVVAGAADILIIFLGIELMSLALYILAGFIRRDIKSNEAALKYFILGSLATCVMIYGMSFIYGYTGSTNLYTIGKFLQDKSMYNNSSLIIGFVFITVGLCFKISVVPFHLWTPDVYEGSLTTVTAFMSVGPKAAGFAALIRFLLIAMGVFKTDWAMILAILSILTMSFSNVVAILQSNIKRMLAYSSIAHTGYIVIGLVAASREPELGISSTIFYLLVYALMNIGAFAVVILISNERTMEDKIENFAGLSRTSPMYAFLMAVFMAALAGIPPTVGFAGKFYLFMSAIKARYTWLAVIGVINSVISVYYYAKVIIKMYFYPPGEESKKPERSNVLLYTISAAVIMVIFLGIFPEVVLNFAKKGIFLSRF
ncbi:MAG: NADH-quinone oxidoreductase subunit N [Candidatus Firestonebacteria bacterium]|nr:NADH-quinone oxidoreductase subunit N [Candidatus Firestonebacteria bacterium]